MRKWIFKTSNPSVWLPLVLSGLLLMLLGAGARAFSTGFVGLSGNPATSDGDTCAACHSGGALPDVMFSGPDAVPAGETAVFQLHIHSTTAAAAGFNISASDGLLAPLPGAPDVVERLEPVYTQRMELTQPQPKDLDSSGTAVFAFQWTAPQQPGEVMLYGAGNVVDGMDDIGGDGVSAAQFVVTVTAVGPAPVFLPAVLAVD